MNTFFKRGHRLFSVASVLTILIGILHTMGLLNEPYNQDWAAAEDAMRGAAIEIGPLTMTLEGMFIGAWIQVGVLLALLGVKNLAVLLALPADGAGVIVRTLSMIDGLTYLGLAALFAVYTIPPPLISFLILAILYFAAAGGARVANS